MIPLPHSGYRRRVRIDDRISRSFHFTNGFIDWINIAWGHNQASNTHSNRNSILFARSSVHSTTNDILHFHNVKASIEPIPHLIRTIEMKSSWNQWNQQRYYQDVEGSKMVKHNPFQMIIEKRENPNESFQLHSQGFYKQWKSEWLDELAFEWENRKQLCFGKWNNDADWTA